MKHTLHSALIVVCLWAALATAAGAQSRTEEARKRMKGESEGDSGVFLTVAELFVEVGPELFYFRPIRLNEPRLGYTPYPYSGTGSGRGIRSFSEEVAERPAMLETRLNLSLPQGSLAMEQRAAELKWHVRYWQFFGQYEYLKELKAPYGIHQFNIMAGRKMRFPTSGDAGVSIGYRNVQLGGDRFDGVEFAWHADLYPVRPVSVSYYGGYMPHTFGDITNNRLSIGVHRGPVRFSVGHHWLDIAGIDFNTFSAGFSLYL